MPTTRSRPAVALTRCPWAEGTAQMQAYHDEEWGVVERDSRVLWEALVLDSFQAGLSWSIILRKREGFRAAFARFDPAAVARFGPRDVERLMGDAGIVRARAKILAAIDNAKAYLAMQQAGVDFSAWAWAFIDGEPIQGTGPVLPQTPMSVTISKALKKRGFKFVGPVCVQSWMQATGMRNDHAPGCFRRHAVGETRSARRPNR